MDDYYPLLIYFYTTLQLFQYSSYIISHLCLKIINIIVVFITKTVFWKRKGALLRPKV